MSTCESSDNAPLVAIAEGSWQHCLSCGACCAYFRVSYYWSEFEALGWPPESLRQLNPLMACLAGTEQRPARCHALSGVVGTGVACTRYAQRPAPCRELQPGDERCNTARAAHGLAPLLAMSVSVSHATIPAQPAPVTGTIEDMQPLVLQSPDGTGSVVG